MFKLAKTDPLVRTGVTFKWSQCVEAFFIVASSVTDVELRDRKYSRVRYVSTILQVPSVVVRVTVADVPFVLNKP